MTDLEDPALTTLKAMGEHFIARGKAMAKFGKDLQNSSSRFSTILKLAREAGLTLRMGIDEPTSTLSSKARHDPPLIGELLHEWVRDIEATKAACDLIEETRHLSRTFLDGLTDSELQELQAYVASQAMRASSGIAGLAPRPNFLPEPPPESLVPTP